MGRNAGDLSLGRTKSGPAKLSVRRHLMRSRSAKPIIDEIDRVLAEHYGFTDEQLNFIPSTKLRAGPSMKLRAGNYDIKYRMGRDKEADEE